MRGWHSRCWCPPAYCCCRSSPELRSWGGGANTTWTYLPGRSQSAPPTSVACRSSYPPPPCPVWERQGWGGLVLVKAGPWKRSHGQTLCLDSQGQARVACQLLQGSQRSWAVLSWPGVIQDREEVENSVPGQLGLLWHPPGWDSSTPALHASLSPQLAEVPGTATGLWLREGRLESGGPKCHPSFDAS